MTDLAWLAQRAQDVPDDLAWLSPAERARLAGMSIAKRRDEFVLGRWTAKQALAAAVPTRAGPALDVAAGGDGAPYAVLDGHRLPVTLRISHRAGMAVALVDLAARPLGCDLEYVEPRTPAFIADYLNDEEQAYVSEDTSLRANVIWSAKESVLKLLQTGLRRAARDVEITVGETMAGAWTAYDGVLRDSGGRFPGWWRAIGTTHLLTVAYDGERPPPDELRLLSR